MEMETIKIIKVVEKEAIDKGIFSAEMGDTSRGEEKYHYLCSRCHGIYGQGDTGPAIFNADFQNVASDYFLS